MAYNVLILNAKTSKHISFFNKKLYTHTKQISGIKKLCIHHKIALTTNK